MASFQRNVQVYKNKKHGLKIKGGWVYSSVVATGLYMEVKDCQVSQEIMYKRKIHSNLSQSTFQANSFYSACHQKSATHK